MRFDALHLWYLGDPSRPRCVGALRLVESGKGVSLRYGTDWLASGFPLSEDLPLVDVDGAIVVEEREDVRRIPSRDRDCRLQLALQIEVPDQGSVEDRRTGVGRQDDRQDVDVRTRRLRVGDKTEARRH